MNITRASITPFLCLLIATALAGCHSSSDGGSPPPAGGGGGGGGGAGGGGGGTTDTVMAPLGTSVKNVPIQPNMPTQFRFTYTIPAGLLNEPLTAYDTFSVNLANTMKNVQVTSAPVASNGQVSAFDPWHLMNRLAKSDLFGRVFGIERALAAFNATVTVFVSFPGDPDVCNSGTQLGPYDFSGDVDMEPTSDADTATASDAAIGINVVTTGVFELCIVVSPLAIPADAYLTVGEVEVEATPCEETPPTDNEVIGDWSGTYTCTNFGTSDDVGLSVALNISKNQDGSYRYTDDGGATYDGHFCGSSFRYKGGVANSYTESGLFIYTGAGSATKRSMWNSVPAGASGGNCTDVLTKD